MNKTISFSTPTTERDPTRERFLHGEEITVAPGDNILGVSMWALVAPASKSYVHQPAYRVLGHTIRPKKSSAIKALVSSVSWRTYRRRGYKCIRVSVVSSSEYSGLMLEKMGSRGANFILNTSGKDALIGPKNSRRMSDIAAGPLGFTHGGG